MVINCLKIYLQIVVLQLLMDKTASNIHDRFYVLIGSGVNKKLIDQDVHTCNRKEKKSELMRN